MDHQRVVEGMNNIHYYKQHQYRKDLGRKDRLQLVWLSLLLMCILRKDRQLSQAHIGNLDYD